MGSSFMFGIQNSLEKYIGLAAVEEIPLFSLEFAQFGLWYKWIGAWGKPYIA